MIKLVKKDLKLFFSNRQDMLLTFALPIIIITLFSLVFGNMGNTDRDKLGGLVHVVAGTSVMMLLFSVAGIGGSLLDEKQEGMLKKLLCSPIPTRHILIAKLVYANIISIIQLLIMFSFARIAFGLDILSYLPSLILMILATSYACAGFGIILASFAKSRQQVQGYSTLVVLIMSAMGGSMIPLFIMPEIMQKMAVVSVNYWSIQGFFDIFLGNLSLTDLKFLSKVFTLIMIGTGLNVVAAQLFKRNILKIA